MLSTPKLFSALVFICLARESKLEIKGAASFASLNSLVEKTMNLIYISHKHHFRSFWISLCLK